MGVIEPDRVLPDTTCYHTIITSSIMSASSLSCPNIARLAMIARDDCTRPGTFRPNSFSPDNKQQRQAIDLPLFHGQPFFALLRFCARARKPKKGSRTDATRHDSFSHDNKQQRQVIDHLFSTINSVRAHARILLTSQLMIQIGPLYWDSVS